MKIAVYGGTGRLGTEVVAEAKSRGHEVTVVSRSEQGAPDGVTWIQGDAADAAAVAGLATTQDVIVSAIAPDPANLAAYAGTIQTLVDNVGSTRLVVVGGAGSLLLPDGTRLIDSPGFPPEYRDGAMAAVDALDVVRAAPSEVDWTFVSPAPEMAVGERTGSYRLSDDTPAGGSISYADFAIVLVDEIESPAHRRARFTAASD